jgi:hypothetical protein
LETGSVRFDFADETVDAPAPVVRTAEVDRDIKPSVDPLDQPVRVTSVVPVETVENGKAAPVGVHLE